MSARALGIGVLALVVAFAVAFAAGKATTSGGEDPEASEAASIDGSPGEIDVPRLATVPGLPALRVPTTPEATSDGGSSSDSAPPVEAAPVPPSGDTFSEPSPANPAPTNPSPPSTDSPPLADPAPE
jgi:hypothetical protein